MKAQLTSHTEQAKVKGGRLASSSLAHKKKDEKESGEASFMGMMIGFTKMKKNDSIAKENSSTEGKKASGGSVQIKVNAAGGENNGDVNLTGVFVAAGAQKSSNTTKEAAGKGSKQNQIKAPGKKPKLFQNNLAAIKVSGSMSKSVPTPAKENIRAPKKAAEDIISNSKQVEASIIFKKAGTDKKSALNERVRLTKVKDSVIETESVASKGEKAKSVINKKKPVLKGFSTLGKNSAEKKSSEVQNRLKPPVSKNGEKAVTGTIIKQEQPVKTTLPDHGKKVLLKKNDRVRETKPALKNRVSIAPEGQQKQAGAVFLRTKSAKAGSKMEEGLIKQVSHQSTQKEDSGALISKKRSVENRAGGFSRTAFTPLKTVSAKSVLHQTGADSQKDIQAINFGDVARSDSEITIKDVEVNNLKTVQLVGTAGQIKFSKLLAHAARPQLNGQAPAAGQTTEWKHHRFILKDGNTVNILARTTNGSLQLQLSAGSDELSKIIQRHLHHIQQHVQQELNIKVDLQFQHFDGQQTGSRQESISKRNTLGDAEADERNLTGNLMEKTGHRNIRYFGFNKNEWVA